jgi:hypothetical protein
MSAVKRRHTVLTVEQKIDICKRLKKGASITSVSKGLGVGKSTICDIRKNKDKLMEFISKMELISVVHPKAFPGHSCIWPNSHGESFGIE